jgi:hypothetical protein
MWMLDCQRDKEIIKHKNALENQGYEYGQSLCTVV